MWGHPTWLLVSSKTAKEKETSARWELHSYGTGLCNHTHTKSSSCHLCHTVVVRWKSQILPTFKERWGLSTRKSGLWRDHLRVCLPQSVRRLYLKLKQKSILLKGNLHWQRERVTGRWGSAREQGNGAGTPFTLNFLHLWSVIAKRVSIPRAYSRALKKSPSKYSSLLQSWGLRHPLSQQTPSWNQSIKEYQYQFNNPLHRMQQGLTHHSHCILIHFACSLQYLSAHRSGKKKLDLVASPEEREALTGEAFACVCVWYTLQGW